MPTYVVKLNLAQDVAALVKNQANVSDNPAPAWVRALGTDIFQTQCGIALGGGKVWVAGWTNGGTGSSIDVYALDMATGAIQGGGVLFTVPKVPSLEAGDWMAYCQGTLLLGYKSGDLDFYNTVNGTFYARLVHTTNVYDIVDICSDGAGHFYVLDRDVAAHSNCELRIFDTQGNTLAYYGHNPNFPPMVNATGTSCCFDPVSGNVIVGYFGGNFDLEIRDGTTLASLAIAQSDLPSGVRGVRPDGAGGFYISGRSGGTMAYRHISSISPYTVVSSKTFTSLPFIPQSPATFLGGADAVPLQSKLRTRGIAVSGGTVIRFDKKGPHTITGGPNSLSASAPMVFSAALGSRLYFADGLNYRYYDANTDSVKTFTASAGSLPADKFKNPPRLIVAWRNRLVWAGCVYDPFNWFMSAVDDGTNYNYAPGVAVETQAVSGNTHTSGVNPDSITALIPYNDELLLFGGVQTIYQMTGDPAAGGRIDLTTDEVGIAWGKAWCKDPRGVLYFFSNQGSVYQLVPGAIPERLSDPVAYLFAGVDLNTFGCRMAYDERQRGFHVWLTQFAGPAATFHYVWDTVNQAWWQDRYANANHNPLCCTPFDGDTLDDRCVLIGSFDGFIRKVDYKAVDDDGTPIASKVYLGPVKQKQGMNFLLGDLQGSLDAASGRVFWDVYSGRDAQSALSGLSRSSGVFIGGRNRSPAIRVEGHAQYVALSSAGGGWALEYLRVLLRTPEGKARQRLFN